MRMPAPVIVIAIAVAQTWPGLWGTGRNGEAPAIGAPRVIKEVWRRSTAGGYSEIAVAGGRAVTAELRGGRDVIVALDPQTGRELWTAEIGATYKGHDGSDDGPIATPTLDEAFVFAVGPHGVLVALDAANGRERWRHDLVKEYGAEVPGWGFGASPLVEGTLVIVPTGGANSRGLLAFDRASGKLAWNTAHARTPAYSSAVSATLAGTRQIVAAAGDRVFAVSPTDGALAWSIAGLGADQAIANPPLILPGDRVLYSSWDTSVMLKIAKEGNALRATEVWRSPKLRAYNGPTVYRDGALFAFVGPWLVCADAATADIKWRERVGEGTLVAAGSHLLVLGQTSGDLRVVRISPERYDEVSRTRVLTPEVVSVTGPSVANGRIFIRNLREIAAFAVGS
jgi:outer membrane protein assembly factor BamB